MQCLFFTLTFLAGVEHEKWTLWFEEQDSYTPETPACRSPFNITAAASTKATKRPCPKGICINVHFFGPKKREVWRSCIPGVAGRMKDDCRVLESLQGPLTVCSCSDSECNKEDLIGRFISGSPTASITPIILSLSLLFYTIS